MFSLVALNLALVAICAFLFKKARNQKWFGNLDTTDLVMLPIDWVTLAVFCGLFVLFGKLEADKVPQFINNLVEALNVVLTVVSGGLGIVCVFLLLQSFSKSDHTKQDTRQLIT